MGGIFINPGSEPLGDPHCEHHAHGNMLTFIMDLEHVEGILATGLRPNPEADNDDGRYGFLIDVDGVPVDVDMPGWPLEEVRYLDLDDQNIWDFPRLYVAGNSWVWKYALSSVKRAVEDANA